MSERKQQNRKGEDIDEEQEDDETYTEEEENDEHKDEEDEITNEEDASLASEEQYIESEEEEYLSDIEEFENGMTLEDREKIKEARALYFEEEAKKLKPQIQEDMKNDIDEEWRGIMTLPELKSTTFDFQILRNLLEAETTKGKGHGSDKNVPHFVNTEKANFEQKRLEKLQAKQKADNWRYDIGLIMEDNEKKKTDTEEGNNIPEELTEEDDNEEEEEIESIE